MFYDTHCSWLTKTLNIDNNLYICEDVFYLFLHTIGTATSTLYWDTVTDLYYHSDLVWDQIMIMMQTHTHTHARARVLTQSLVSGLSEKNSCNSTGKSS